MFDRNTDITLYANSLLTSCSEFLQVLCIHCEDRILNIAHIYNANTNPEFIWNYTKFHEQHGGGKSLKLDEVENTLVEIENSVKPRSSPSIESFSSILKSELK